MLPYPDIAIDQEYDPIKRTGSPIAFYHSDNKILLSGANNELEIMNLTWEQTIVHETTHWCLVMAIPKRVRSKLWNNEFSLEFMEKVAWEICEDV